MLYRVPFYIAAPRTTLDPSLHTGEEIKIEEREPSELTHHQGKQVAALGIQARLLSSTLPALKYLVVGAKWLMLSYRRPDFPKDFTAPKCVIGSEDPCTLSRLILSSFDSLQ